MGKRKKKIDLKQLLKDADQLLIPRAMLVKNYGLKNKASLRTLLSSARKIAGSKSPMNLRGQTPKPENPFSSTAEGQRRYRLRGRNWRIQDEGTEEPLTAISSPEETAENNDEYERYLRERQIERYKNWEKGGEIG